MLGGILAKSFERRALSSTPAIGYAPTSDFLAPSSSGLGRWPLTLETGVRVPVGSIFPARRSGLVFPLAAQG